MNTNNNIKDKIETQIYQNLFVIIRNNPHKWEYNNHFVGHVKNKMVFQINGRFAPFYLLPILIYRQISRL